MRKSLLTGLLAATVAAGLMGAANADTFYRSIYLQNNDVQVLPINGIDVGDTVQLKLLNGSYQPLTFQTTQQLGSESKFMVNPKQERVVNFTYNRPFSEELKYVVYNSQGHPVSKNVLVNIDADNDLGEDIFHQEVSLSPGNHEFDFDNIDKGEAVMLHLKNESNNDYWVTIEDSDHKTQDKRLVKANTNRNIAFEYPHYFGDEVELEVEVAEMNTMADNTATYQPTMRTQTTTTHTHAHTHTHSNNQTAVKDMTGWNGNAPEMGAEHLTEVDTTIGSRPGVETNSTVELDADVK